MSTGPVPEPPTKPKQSNPRKVQTRSGSVADQKPHKRRGGRIWGAATKAKSDAGRLLGFRQKTGPDGSACPQVSCLHRSSQLTVRSLEHENNGAEHAITTWNKSRKNVKKKEENKRDTRQAAHLVVERRMRLQYRGNEGKGKKRTPSRLNASIG